MLESNAIVPENHKIQIPGDKSISHRSVLFSSLAEGKSVIRGFLEAEDPVNTMKSLAKMGVQFKKTGGGIYEVNSPGKKKLHAPLEDLDFGNAGTGIRLTAGLIAGLEGVSAVLTGDESLRKRPMKRILDPLQEMGADAVSISGDGRAPLKINGKKLNQISYKSPISSAQVKSCLMLGAISSDTGLSYDEPELSRNHTENMLRFLGGKIRHQKQTKFEIFPPFHFKGTEFLIPGDISSAAFFIVLGLLAKKGSLRICNVGLNPARTGILTVLGEMGGDMKIENLQERCGETTGDIIVRPSRLHKIQIAEDLIPSIIDEIPILTIAGLFSKDGFKITGAEELRAKESDRISCMVKNLIAIGAEVEESKDGYEVGELKEIKNARIESFMDHRIAMSFSVLDFLIPDKLQIDDESWIDTSFPEFKKIRQSLLLKKN